MLVGVRVRGGLGKPSQSYVNLARCRQVRDVADRHGLRVASDQAQDSLIGGRIGLDERRGGVPAKRDLRREQPLIVGSCPYAYCSSGKRILPNK